MGVGFFCDKRKLKWLNMASDMILIKRKEFILILQSFTPSDMIMMSKVIYIYFGKNYVTKKLLLSYILNF